MTNLPSGRLAALATAGLIGAVALTGCGAGGGDAGAADGSDASPVAATSQDVDPAEVAALVRDGVASLTTARLEVTASGGMVAGTAAGPLDLTGDTPALSLVTDESDGVGAMLGGPAELRVVDGKGYVQVPVVTGSKFADLDDVLGQVGPLLQQFSGMSGFGSDGGHDLGKGDLPGSVREALRAFDAPAMSEKAVSSASSAELAGSEDVDGVTTDHYVLTFDHAGEQQDVDVYLDDDGVPVRTEAETPMGTVRADLTDLGAPVDITAPPASQLTTLDLDSVLGGLGGFTTSG